MVKTISAYYFSIPWNSPLTGVICSQYTLSLFVWSGAKASVPATAKYEITKENLAASTGTDKIDISGMLNDYIDTVTTLGVSTGAVASTNQKWYHVEVEYTTGNAGDTGTAQLNETDLFIKGYGYGNEGENPQPPTSRLYLTGRIFKVNRTSIFQFALKQFESGASGTVEIESFPNGEINSSIAISNTTDSDVLVKSIAVVLTESTFDEYVTIDFNSEKITLLIQDEAKFTPVEIYYFNKQGQQQGLTFFKERKDTLEITREQYESVAGQPLSGYHQFKDFNIQGKSKFTVASGYISDTLNDAFKELLLSEKVYSYKNGSMIPVNVLKTSLVYKTRLNDKLVNYKFEFGYSYNEINNV